MSYKDKEWLESKYQNHTQEEIADMCGVSRPTITRWMQKHGIETRDGWQQADGKYKDRKWLKEKYIDEQRSIADLANECGVAKTTITHWLKKFGIGVRSQSDAAKIRAKRYVHTIPDNEKLHPTFYNRRGYEVIKCGVNDKHVEHHRLLATLLVDDLSELDGMHVHHENGVRWDNRLENLGILSVSDHTKEHHRNGDYPQSA